MRLTRKFATASWILSGESSGNEVDVLGFTTRTRRRSAHVALLKDVGSVDASCSTVDFTAEKRSGFLVLRVGFLVAFRFGFGASKVESVFFVVGAGLVNRDALRVDLA